MPKRSEFVEYLLELLAPLGEVRARSMFGGFGVYLGDVIFGLVISDVLYLKVDEKTRPDFESRGLAPFTYAKQDGEVAVMSYYRAPEDALEDSDELCRWARQACEVSLRASDKKSAGKRPRKTKKKR